MEKYLVIITTVLVVTQVIRLVQNTISLKYERRRLQAGLDELDTITNMLAIEWCKGQEDNMQSMYNDYRLP